MTHVRHLRVHAIQYRVTTVFQIIFPQFEFNCLPKMIIENFVLKNWLFGIVDVDGRIYFAFGVTLYFFWIVPCIFYSVYSCTYI